MAEELTWIESNGGPLLLLSDEFADAWLGADPPQDGRTIQARFRSSESSPACDYDRACDIEGLVGQVTVGRGSALVLGDQPLETVWRPSPNADGGVLVRCRYGESDEEVEGWLSAMPDVNFDLSVNTFETRSGRAALFDAAFSGSTFLAHGAGEWLALRPGLYRVGVAEWEPDAASAFLLHHLCPALRYLAYGSNMLSKRFRERVPSATVLGVTELQGWAPAFHKRGQDGSGKCGLVQSQGPGSTVHGVVFSIARDEKQHLDAVEGLGYRSEELEVELDGQATKVFTYLAQDSHIDDKLLPYDWYRDLVVAGALEHGLPNEYVRWLRTQASCSDPDRSRAAMNEALLRSKP